MNGDVIKGIIPAKGWWVILKDEDGDFTADPLSCWAIVEMETDGETYDTIQGMVAWENVMQAENISNFVRYWFGPDEETVLVEIRTADQNDKRREAMYRLAQVGEIHD